MDSSRYSLRQRQFSVTVSSQSLTLVYNTVSTADSLATAGTGGLTPAPIMAYPARIGLTLAPTLVYIYLFVDKPTGQTARRIFMRDGSNNAALRKG